jgi:superfamily II DNA or RNA helicase
MMPPVSSQSDLPDDPDAWRSLLGELIEPGGESQAPRPEPTPMALQFTVREQVIRSAPRELFHSEAAGRKPKPSGVLRRPAAQLRLGVRPVVRSATGNWVKSTISWSNVAHQLNRLNLDPEQHRWFSQFPSLHRASAPVFRGDSDWLDLDEFASPLLWHLLEDAARVGIALVGPSRNTRIVVGTAAELTLDATRMPDGGVLLAPAVAIDGEAHSVDAVGVIGGHGVYSLEPGADGDDAVLILAPTVSPVTSEQRALLTRTSTLVPPGDVDDFLTDYYPALRHTVRVTSADGSVTFPEVPPPLLVLTATYRPHHALRLEWHWQYRHGTAAIRMPLRPTAGDPGYRDDGAERALIDRIRLPLAKAGVLDEHGALSPTVELRGDETADFTEHRLPELQSLDGVRVEVVGTKPAYRELTDAPRLTVTTVETDERDWFDLGVIVTVDGRNVPFGPLFTALAKGSKRLLLTDGSYLSLKRPVFDRLRELIDEARTLDEWETGARISRAQASLWSDFEDLADEAQPATSWRELVSGLADAEKVPDVPTPAQLTATLRPYQEDGFRWLAFLHSHRLGGILADDMGLGKTLQTLALLAHARDTTPAPDRRPFLVVAPASVVPNWVAETNRFAPELRVTSIASTQASNGTSIADAAAGADVVVTSYALVRLDFEAYDREDWAGLILDEAQFVKNRASAAHQVARDFRAPFKLAITGTPMENDLMELWSLFAIVAPGLFPSARRFAEHYQRPIERSLGVRAVAGIRSRSTRAGSGPDTDEERAAGQRLEKLRRRIRPLLLRRTKEDVAKELPPKQEQVLQIELTDEHRLLYDTFLQRERQKLLGLLEDLDRNRFIVFRSLTLLRLLSLDASLVDEQYAGVGSAKLDGLLEQLDDVIAEGHRALVFSQFTSFLGKVGARLVERGIEYAYLDGSTRRRGEVIDGFKDGEAPVFLISLKAGGFGLNLTEADYVFLLDPWWNPAAEEQAVDRTHRIGQARNVMVYRMVAAGTIEEKVMALKEKKARLFDSVLDDGDAFSAALTAEDFRTLLDG